MSREDRKAIVVLLLMTTMVIAFLVSTKQIKGGIQEYIPNIDKILHPKAKAASDEDIEINGIQEDNDIKEEQFDQDDEFGEDNDIKEEQRKNNIKAD